MEIEIRVRDDKRCAVCRINSYGNEEAAVEGLTPEQAATVKQLLLSEYRRGGNDTRDAIRQTI